MKTLRWRSQVMWAPVAAALVACAVLAGATLLIRSEAKGASHLVARGLGQAFSVSAWETFMHSDFPPQQEVLQELLERHAEDGLRYVAIIRDDGQVLTQAGEAIGAGVTDGLVLVGDRARLVHRIRPAPSHRRARRWAAPGLDGPRRRRRMPRVVFEFEPRAAVELQRRARGLVVLAALSCAGVMGLAFALSRSLGQRERMREELEHGRRLAALGSMSAVLAHELRNPLASLKGHAQLLAETVEADLRLAPKVNRVVSEAVRLERLMDDLLMFVKTGELHRAPTDAAEVLKAAVRATGEPSFQVSVPDHPVRAVLDADRLQQALENVLRNAVQASAEGGKVHASVAEEKGEVVFRVRDSGAGIPAGQEERIFEPFITDRIRGVGLGLAITRRIVEQHGGGISAHNRPEGGAEFQIRIPKGEAS